MIAVYPEPLSSCLASWQMTFSKDQASVCSHAAHALLLRFARRDPREVPIQFPQILTQGEDLESLHSLVHHLESHSL